jgi:hypothetical protein
MSDRVGRIDRIAHLVGALVAGGVLVWSATYFVVYLGRWEWNRAIVSGLVALGLLMVLSTSTVLRRLASLDRRVTMVIDRPLDRSLDGTGEATGELIGEANVAAARHRFDWLSPDGSTTAVFIPVLLGTGVILSLVAYAIERVAGAFAGSTLDRRTASIIPLDLPLSAGVPAHAVAASTPASSHPGKTGVGGVVLILVGALTLGLGVEVIRRVTQSSEGDLHVPGTTTIVVDVATKRDRTPEAAVTSIWQLCRTRIDEPGVRSTTVDGGRVTITLDRALLTTAERRLTGCFEDLVLDYAIVDVLTVTAEPTPAAD